MTTATKAKIAAAILIVAGPFLTLNGMADKDRLAKLEKDGVTVDGTLNSGEDKRSGRRSRSYTFNASFMPDGSSPVSKDFKVTKTFFEAHAADGYIKDETIQIRFLPEDPANTAIIVGGSTDSTEMFPIGIGCFVVGLGIAGYFFLRRSPAAPAV